MGRTSRVKNDRCNRTERAAEWINANSHLNKWFGEKNRVFMMKVVKLFIPSLLLRCLFNWFGMKREKIAGNIKATQNPMKYSLVSGIFEQNYSSYGLWNFQLPISTTRSNQFLAISLCICNRKKQNEKKNLLTVSIEGVKYTWKMLACIRSAISRLSPTWGGIVILPIVRREPLVYSDTALGTYLLRTVARTICVFVFPSICRPLEW